MKDYIKHFGILGQKWGVRNYQYSDGRFTPEGKERYFGKEGNKYSKIVSKRKYIDDIYQNNADVTNLLALPFIRSPAGAALFMTATVYSYLKNKKLMDTEMKDLVKKGNSLTDKILKKYGNKTLKEVDDEIRSNFSYSRRGSDVQYVYL